MLDIFDLLSSGCFIVAHDREHERIVLWNGACTLTLWHADPVSEHRCRREDRKTAVITGHVFDQTDVRTMAVDGERATLDYAEQRARVWLDELRKENGES